MSGIAGVVGTDGRPVDRARFAAMLAAIAHRGQSEAWIDGPVALARLRFTATPDVARRESIAFAGRIDNGPEVADACSLSYEGDDEEVVLRAYARWGEDFAAHLVGDFAVALWDASSHALVCARDTVGVKPFFYTWDGALFAFASEPRALVLGGFARPHPNEAMVGEYLACRITSTDETLLRDVMRLPPAHTLRVESRRIARRRYWDLAPLVSQAAPSLSDDEHASRFLDTFREAVRCRLRTDPSLARHQRATIGAHVSGGLDSSSVACVAEALRRETGGPRVLALSLAFPGEACDESGYADAVVARWGLDLVRRTPDVAAAAVLCPELARRDFDFPGHPNGAMGDVLRAAARQEGCSILLTGQGGDDWLQGSPARLRLVDLLREGRARAFVRSVRPADIRPLMRLALKRLARFALRPRFVASLESRWIPRWIRPELRRRIALADRVRRRPSDGVHWESACERALYDDGMSAWGVHAGEMEERASARYGLEERHPFHDRRLVELCFALPEDQRMRQDERKFVLRRAMRGVLPEEVRTRRDKPSFEEVFVRALEARGGEQAFRSLAVAEAGWVDEAALRTEYRATLERRRRGSDFAGMVWPLWMALGVEDWLRALQTGTTDTLIPRESRAFRS